MLFFTGDNHFFHKNILKYCLRPFNSVEGMNETMIERWNSVVKTGDVVFCLGDFILSNRHSEIEYVLNKLAGEIVLILGDHDSKVMCKKFQNRFTEITKFYQLRLPDNLEISLFHYPIARWPKSHYNSLHCYSHCHGGFKNHGKSLDVGVDCHNFYPVSLDKLKDIMKLKPDNENLIKTPKEEGKYEQIEMEYTF